MRFPLIVSMVYCVFHVFVFYPSALIVHYFIGLAVIVVAFFSV